ncbi:MAG: tetratricopeptide repeat protein [Paludibacteraceae bacterium]|nr:tetratricopeptide repeat protein [Paludibacteraceae bacterium]
MKVVKNKKILVTFRKKFFLCFTGLILSTAAHAQWNTDRIMDIGKNAFYFEDYVLSIQYFNQVIKIKPYLSEPYIYRAMAKIQLGDYQGADEDCTQAIEKNPFVPQAYYARGFARLKMNFCNEAIEDFSKALEFSPENIYLLNYRLIARDQCKDYAGALNDIDEYLKLSPKSTEMYYEKGRILLALKDTVGAEQSFDKYIQLNENNSLGWSARALLKMQKNDKKGALKDYDEAIKRNSTYSGDYINRGVLNTENKNFRQALADYDKAISLDKNNELAYFNRGLLRATLGDKNNALADFTKVLELNPSNTDALWQKATMENSLGNYTQSIKDFSKIIEQYPYFIPAYSGIAEAYQKLGDEKNAFRYRQMAYNIEQNKNNIKKEELAAGNKIAKETQKNVSEKNLDFFNRFAVQDKDDIAGESKYTNNIRGAVQNRYADVVNEKNFVLTYYSKVDEIRRTNLFHLAIERYNSLKKLPLPLKITNNELPLTAEMISQHFDAINSISAQLEQNSSDADIYFARAIEFALVQDFKSAIDDLNKAISLKPDFMPAYFTRANIRYKMIETNSNGNLSANASKQGNDIGSNNQLKFDMELILRDYDKVIELVPDFTFAYYNKANVLTAIRDFRSAVSYYSKALDIDPDFAEAYFNRGLTYLFIGEDKNGLSDLSKAGELGIYKSYNLIQRFKQQKEN